MLQCDKVGDHLILISHIIMNNVRMNMLLQRSLVRSCETSHASLLIPVLRIMERITSLAASRDISCHSSQMFRRLASSLCKKIMISSDAIKRSNSGKKKI